MENFKFFTDRTPLTPSEILAHKDFSKVLQNYKNVPVKFYKSGWFKAGLATVTVAATGTILFFATGTNKNNGPDKTATAVTAPAPYADETPCVKSPIAKIDVPAVSFTVDASRDTVLYYETGSAIQFKGNSITDENGKPVSGKIELRYREFHNPLEVFASGIPMKYDSAGTDWHLKSAGMIELTAYQNGKPVFILPEKPIDVQMKSGKDDGEYSVYFLDTAKRNWDYKGQDFVMNAKVEVPKVKLNETKKADPSKLKLDTVKIKNELKTLMPHKPRLVNPKEYTFTLDVLESEFPELAIYGTTKFEIIDKANNVNNQLYAVEWEDASLKEKVKGERYDLTLVRGSVMKTFEVVPVLDGKEYKAAIELYNKKYKEYQEKLNGRIKEEKKKIDLEKQKMTSWEKEADEKHRLRIQDFTAANIPNDQVLARFGTDNSTKSLVTRAFTVSKFGVWNCDKPMDYPRGEKVVAKFFDESGEQMPLTSVYLCERDSKMMYTYNANDLHKFRYNPAEKNIIWGMTTDGKLAYGLEETFAAENRKGKEMIFKLNVVNEKIVTLKQVKELLNI